MLITKEHIKAMTLVERMELIDMIWEVTDAEHPKWIEERNEDEVLAEQEETESEEIPSESKL